MESETGSQKVRQWLVLSDGVQSGPLAEPLLRTRIATGDIRPESLVSCGNGWITAFELSNFANKTKQVETDEAATINRSAPIDEWPDAEAAAEMPAMAARPASEQTGISPRAALAEPPPERDRIVVLGRRQSGKTIYLSGLYAGLWRATRGMSAKALSGEVHKHLMDAHAQLNKGAWPAATLGTSRLELEIEYHGSKHLLVSLDFAGEVFARAFLHEQSDTPEVRELLNHIDRAAAVLLLVDPSIGAGADHEAAMEDDFGLVQAVQRIRNWPGGDQVPVVVVLTKMDVYQGLVDHFGGTTGLVQHHFPALVRTLKRVIIFQVSAVQVVKDAAGKLRPSHNFVPVNLESPLKHCLRAIEAARQENARQRLEQQQRIEEQIEAQQQERWEKRQILILVIVVSTIVLAGAAIVAHMLHVFKWL
jgi:GTPase SAR1 family protein